MGASGSASAITYSPGASREEIFRLFEIAKREDVPIYVHVRGENSGGTLGAFQEVIANAASTGASLHIVHMNSSAQRACKDDAEDDPRCPASRVWMSRPNLILTPPALHASSQRCSIRGRDCRMRNMVDSSGCSPASGSTPRVSSGFAKREAG